MDQAKTTYTLYDANKHFLAKLRCKEDPRKVLRMAFPEYSDTRYIFTDEEYANLSLSKQIQFIKANI